MALHGTIEINGRELVLWSARRLHPLWLEDQVSSYKIEITWAGTVSGALKYHEEVIEHRYSDGCESLTEKVMKIAVRERPGP